MVIKSPYYSSAPKCAIRVVWQLDKDGSVWFYNSQENVVGQYHKRYFIPPGITGRTNVWSVGIMGEILESLQELMLLAQIKINHGADIYGPSAGKPGDRITLPA